MSLLRHVQVVNVSSWSHMTNILTDPYVLENNIDLSDTADTNNTPHTDTFENADDQIDHSAVDVP